jgi:hypothetical protein
MHVFFSTYSVRDDVEPTAGFAAQLGAFRVTPGLIGVWQ